MRENDFPYPSSNFPYPSSKSSTTGALKLPKRIRHLSIPTVLLSFFIGCRAAWGYMSCASFDDFPEVDDPMIKQKITQLVGEKNIGGIRKSWLPFYVVQPNKKTCKSCFYHLIRLIDGSPQTLFVFQGTGKFLDIEPFNIPLPELSDQYDMIAIETVDSYLHVQFPHHGGPVFVHVAPKEIIAWLPRCSRAPAK